MKKPVLLFLLTLMVFPVFGQEDFSVEWGEEFKQSRRYALRAILGPWNGGIVVEKSKGGSILAPSFGHKLEYLDKNLNLVRSVDYSFRAENEPLLFSFGFPYRGRMYMFGSLPDPKSDENALYCQEIDPAGLKGKTPFQKLMNVPLVKGRKDNTFDFRFSRDSSHLLLFAPITERRKDRETFQFQVLNDEMEKIWERTVTLPYEAGLFDVEDFVVDHEGTLYLLGTRFNEVRRLKRGGEPNYVYEIHTFHQDNSLDNQVTVSLEDKFLVEMAIGVKKNLDIICAGFYSSKGTYSIAGTYFLVVDGETEELKAKKFKEFDIDFITQNMTDRQERKVRKKEAKGKEQEMLEYDLGELILHSNGGAVLIAEQYYVQVFSTFNASTGTFNETYVYNYHDIIAVNLNAAGEIEWAQKIPKRQVSTNDFGYYSSYAAFIRPNKLHFIYNERADNLEKEENLRNYRLDDKKGIVAIASIDGGGNLQRRPLMSNNEIEVITIPKLSIQVGKNELILYAQKRRGVQFGRVKFNE